MREIKFRAWYKSEMLENVAVINGLLAIEENPTNACDGIQDENGRWYYSNWAYYKIKPDATLMQYTGLKDKNGKEIYEGDIVQRIFQERAYQKCEVKFEDGTFGVEDYDQAGISSLWALRGRSHHFMIIGNIFENPELLEAKIEKRGFSLMRDLINQMLDGEIDIYQIHTSPEGEAQRQLSKEIDTLYNEAAQSGHHLDDDAEAIYKSILGQYENLLKHYLKR